MHPSGSYNAPMQRFAVASTSKPWAAIAGTSKTFENGFTSKLFVSFPDDFSREHVFFSDRRGLA